MDDIDSRIAGLLDQLENPNLSDKEQDRIEKKIEFLRGQRS
jgi:hypothetical protein